MTGNVVPGANKFRIFFAIVILFAFLIDLGNDSDEGWAAM
jgi:hypothetical protein